jgi:phosphatidylserine/phosphatidylglycerophosphate/cardiolipin synthase-like enzyme
MVVRFFTVILATTLLVTGSASAAMAWEPRPGALFNDPSLGARAGDRLVSHVKAAINHAPRNSVIRLASYSFDRRDVTDALLRACDRGVSIQMVLNDNWTSRQTKRLARRLGTNINPHYKDACHPVDRPEPDTEGTPVEETADEVQPEPWHNPSFVKICYQSCRGGAGNQHMKFYLFSRTGQARNVIMVGSANLTGFAARVHWNDLFTVRGRGEMFDYYGKIFRQLARDRWMRHRFDRATFGDLTTEIGPLRRVGLAKDPVTRRLAKVRCRALGGTGYRGHTVIKISMYGWNGERGRYLADRVADLDRRGCHVSVIVSSGGRRVVGILRRGGVAVRSADLDLDNDSRTGFDETAWEQFTHEKFMTLSGTYAGRGRRIVWTGSENWSGKSLLNDEVTLMIPRRGAYRAYTRHFGYEWARHTRAYY